MSRLEVKTPDRAQAVVEQIYRNMERRIAASPPGLCPVDMALNSLDLCRAQTCGKCVPCRIGLTQLSDMLSEILDGEADMRMLRHLEETAQVIVDTADCAIGIDAANLILTSVRGFREDFEEHILHHRCLSTLHNPVPCVAMCPAGVDIPGYISLVNAGRYADAVRLVRKDNPFATACAYICEHPCESRCRRNMVDDAINIRGMKRAAVDMLRHIGDNEMPDFTGMNVAVIGGGNVAMDVTRSAIRLGAKKVTCVYRRRQEDMTAQPEEVEGAIAEGAEVLTLHAPIRIEARDGRAVALWAQPQIIGEVDKAGRPRPNTAAVEPVRIPADLIIVAIGQGIESQGFEQAGIKIQRGGTLLADSSTRLPEMEGVFAGGDCVTGPATVIRAIAAGKAAADNIDEYLGFSHEIRADVEIPTPRCTDIRPRGRVDSKERDADERKHDFLCMECSMTDEEVAQESGRCLRCDHFGYGSFKGGRIEKW